MSQSNMFEGDNAIKFDAFSKDSFTYQYLEKPVWEKQLNQLANIPELRAIDLGCGSGRLTQLLVNTGFDPRNISGVDTSQDLLAIAHSAIPKARFLYSSTGCLDLESDSQTVVVSHMVFEFLDRKQLNETLSESHRILVPNGTLMFMTTHPDYIIRQGIVNGEEECWYQKLSPWGTQISNYFRSKEAIIDSLVNSGFSVLDIEAPIFNDPHRFPKATASSQQFGPSRLFIKAVNQG